MPFFFRPGDLPDAMRLLAQDRGLFQKGLWNRLPELILDLMERKRLVGGVVEDLETSKLAFFGMTGWATPERIGKVLQGKPALFRDALLREESIFLSTKQVATVNGSGDLALVNLGGCPDEKDFGLARGFEVHRMAFSFFMKVHAGYRISEFWQENLLAEASLQAEPMGMSEVRRSGGVGRLFCFSRADAAAKAGAQLAYLMKYPPPRLGFTQPQQRLLELALLDYADAAAAEELGISSEAVRKRWRAIHARHEFGEGKDQRRELLAYVRQHLEELRPWPKT